MQSSWGQSLASSLCHAQASVMRAQNPLGAGSVLTGWEGGGGVQMACEVGILQWPCQGGAFTPLSRPTSPCCCLGQGSSLATDPPPREPPVGLEKGEVAGMPPTTMRGRVGNSRASGGV